MINIFMIPYKDSNKSKYKVSINIIGIKVRIYKFWIYENFTTRSHKLSI